MKFISLFILTISFSCMINAQNKLENYFYVDVKIKGKHYKFLFDNGFSHTAIFDHVPIRSKLKILNGNDGFEKKPVPITDKKIDLRLPKYDLHHKLQVIIIPGPPPLLEHKVDGIIGWDIISRHDWVLNFSDMSIELVENKKNELNQYGYQFKIFKPKKFKGGDWVDMNTLRVNKDKKTFPLRLQIDLGYLGFIKSGLNDIPAISIEKDLVKIGKTSTIHGERTDTSYIQNLDVELGNFKLSNIPVEYYSSDRLAILGLEFLGMFEEVILMYSNESILLKPIKNFHLKRPDIDTHLNKIKNLLVKSSDLSGIKWNIGDEILEPLEVIKPDAFQWEILFEKK